MLDNPCILPIKRKLLTRLRRKLNDSTFSPCVDDVIVSRRRRRSSSDALSVVSSISSWDFRTLPYFESYPTIELLWTSEGMSIIHEAEKEFKDTKQARARECYLRVLKVTHSWWWSCLHRPRASAQQVPISFLRGRFLLDYSARGWWCGRLWYARIFIHDFTPYGAAATWRDE